MAGRAIFIGLICAAPLSAIAATLPISGTYGNPAGCTLARTKNYGEDDSARILRPDGVESMVTACSFNTVTTLANGRHQVTMTCSSEGSGPEDESEEADISGSTDAGYTVRFRDGTTWGPLVRC
jgi:hypothetical protein